MEKRKYVNPMVGFVDLINLHALQQPTIFRAYTKYLSETFTLYKESVAYILKRDAHYQVIMCKLKLI